MVNQSIRMKSHPSTAEKDLLVAALLCAVDLVLIGVACYFSNSLTLMSDFLKEAADFLAVTASFFTLRAVRKAPSERFAYGIGKLENVISLFMGLLMLACAVFILTQAVRHLQSPPEVVGTLPGIAIFAAYSVIGFVIAARHYRSLQVQRSPIVSSQLKLWLSKASFDALMAIALAVVHFLPQYPWTRWIDPLASMVGAGFLLVAAWFTSFSSVDDLLDSALDEQLQMRILKVLVDHFDDYQELHTVRTRRSGSRIYIEVHLSFHAELLMKTVLAQLKTIKQGIEAQIPGSEVLVVPHSN